MPALGANAAIIRDQKILLTLRTDFEVWCLPGGGVEPDESLAEAAIREAREETGFEVRLTRLVGLYSRTGWIDRGLHVASFAAEITGGELRPQPEEVLAARFFAADELPAEMLLGHRQRALDALNGIAGAAWRTEAEWPFPEGMTRQELYERCAQSGLPKSEFYLRFVGKPKPEGNICEVAGAAPVNRRQPAADGQGHGREAVASKPG